MPVSHIRRTVSRLLRKTKSWATIVGLTLQGNSVNKEAKLKNCKNPVLMIYGFGATRPTLAILEKRLKQDGYTIFSLNLGGIFDTFNTDSIEDVSRRLDEKIERLYKKYTFRGRLSIIGHSKGGLIGNYYVKRLGGAKRVKTLITLGSPHNGNPWAMIAAYTPVAWICKSLQQMNPMSRFIKDLKAIPFPKALKVFSIYSRSDSICPFPVAVLDENEHVKNIEVYGLSHSELLIKKNVYNAIKHALRDEMPQSWEDVSRQNIKDHMEEKKNSKLRLISGIKGL